MGIIIDYIVKYQNFFVSSYLFQKNFPDLIEKGVLIKPLLDSEVFSFSFDLDEWPTSHFNPDELIRPFNVNIFQIRKHYSTIFPEEEFEPMDSIEDNSADKKSFDSSKIYKIKYSINLLPSLGTHIFYNYNPYTKKYTKELHNEGVNIPGLFCDSDQLEIFDCETLQELIEFKWNEFGMPLHLFGIIIHFCYIVILFLYTNLIYLQGLEEGNVHNPYSIYLLAGIIYPALYEII